ncbi:hypothetical protein HY357_00810 [Candidatus Roizmanbacteria bacterium]|nr:hypothetical protein [Candidatus Roizmanbacteria bacterium]
MLQKELHSDAFSLEFGERLTSKALYKHIESYLGEYRFQLPLYTYDYDFSQTRDLQYHLVDPNTQESMLNKVYRSIERRKLEGKNFERETAELYGLQFLEEKLSRSTLGDSIIWASPPGKKIDGYGNYGFIFYGVVDSENNGRKHLSMVARRVDNPTIEKFNLVMTALIGKIINFNTPEDFLTNPFLVRFGEGAINPEETIAEIFGVINWEVLEKFKKTMTLLQPLIDEFITSVQNNDSIFRQKKLLNAIENMSITVKEDNKSALYLGTLSTYQVLQIGLSSFSYQPPKAIGSCGSTGESKSPLDANTNILNKWSLENSPLDKLLKEDHTCNVCGKDSRNHFHCPDCGKTLPSGVGVTACPPKEQGGCGLTKEAYAKRAGISCD